MTFFAKARVTGYSELCQIFGQKELFALDVIFCHSPQ